MSWTAEKKQDKATAKIYAALKKTFPEISEDQEQVVYRYNPVAVRVRVISPKFQGKSDAEREEMVLSALDSLPPEVNEDITLILMLTPREAKRPDAVYREFDEPERYL